MAARLSASRRLRHTGAKIEVEGSIDVLQAREFFLVLSSNGLAYRRCGLIWIDGATVGVRFVKKQGC